MSRVSKMPEGVRIEISGHVQGVGFRPWVQSVASAAGIRGRLFNAGSRVIVEAFGTAEALDSLVRQLWSPPVPAAVVDQLCVAAIHIAGQLASSGITHLATAFDIAESATGDGLGTPAILPDLAVCADCRRDLFDPRDHAELVARDAGR